MKISDLHYSGDISSEYGGAYFNINDRDYNNGYCNVLRIVPCSDAGCQSNAWWIEELTINIPSTIKDINEVLSVFSYKLDDIGNIIDPYTETMLATPNNFGFKIAIVEACLAYGKYDKDTSMVVQIGKIDSYESNKDVIVPDFQLRGNVSLERYIKKYLKNWIGSMS